MSIAILVRIMTIPTARLRVFASDLLAIIAAILAQRSVNAAHRTIIVMSGMSLLQSMLHFMEKKTGCFLHMKEMSLLSITIFFRSLVIRNSQRSIPDSSKDIIRVF